MTENQDHRKENRALSPLLADAPRESPHRIPEGYFEALPGEILKRVDTGSAEPAMGEETAKEETERLSPLLAGAMGTNPFLEKPGSIDLPALMAGTASAGEPTPSVPLRRTRIPAWAAYAAAAAVTGIMALAVFKRSGDAETDGLKDKATTSVEAGRSADSTLSSENDLADYMDASLDPILITAEASDTLMLADAFLILHSTDTAQTGLFDDVPTQDLYAYIEGMPDLSGTRLDLD